MTNGKKMKMKKNMLAFLLVFAGIFLAAGMVSAAGNGVVKGNSLEIEVEGQEVYDANNGGIQINKTVTAGETVSLRVLFDSNVTAQDIRVEAELEGEQGDTEAESDLFIVEEGERYDESMLIDIPYELQDGVSENLTLDLKIYNDNYRTQDNYFDLRVHRPSYTGEIVSIESASQANAGELYPVDVVLKNRGYEDMDEVDVSVSVPSLGIERTSHFGDLDSIGNGTDEDDVEKGRFFLDLPQDAQEGEYTIEVEASSDQVSESATKRISLNNEFSSGNFFVDSLQKNVEAGQEANFQMTIANPTDQQKVYRLVVESSGDVSTSPQTRVVSVPAGVSKNVIVSATPESEGEHKIGANLISATSQELVDSKELSVSAGERTADDSNSVDGSVVALTIVLAVIFLVLLGILIALLKKKPQKSEEFGESYY